MHYFFLSPHQIVGILRGLFRERKVPWVIQEDVNCAVQLVRSRCAFDVRVSHVLAYEYPAQ